MESEVNQPATLNDNTNQKNSNQSSKSIWSILALIFLGPIGLIIMWLIAPWNKTVKIILTVIELVIIAVIATLVLFATSVVLTSLDSARDKASDAKIQSDVRSFLSASEIYLDNLDDINTGFGGDDKEMMALAPGEKLYDAVINAKIIDISSFSSDTGDNVQACVRGSKYVISSNTKIADEGYYIAMNGYIEFVDEKPTCAILDNDKMTESSRITEVYNITRRSDIDTYINAIHQQAIDTGKFNKNITVNCPETQSIDNGPLGGGADLSNLSPDYISELPIDPSISSGNMQSSTAVDTGYQVCKSLDNEITVSAPNAQSNEVISETR